MTHGEPEGRVSRRDGDFDSLKMGLFKIVPDSPFVKIFF